MVFEDDDDNEEEDRSLDPLARFVQIVFKKVSKQAKEDRTFGLPSLYPHQGEFLKEAKPFVEDGVHPQNLIKSYRTASYLAIEKIKELASNLEGKSLEEKKELLANCSATTLSSKLIGEEKEFFAKMVADVSIAIGDEDRLNMIGI